MTLAIILIVLLIDRLLWQGDPLRAHQWYDRYTDRLLASATGQWLARKDQGALWMLLPPLLVIVVLQWLAGEKSGFVIGAVVLLFSLGPRDLGRDANAYLSGRERGGDSHGDQAAAALAGSEPPADEPERSLAVARGLLEQSLPRLFAPLLWFVLLGPLGAALYRLAALTAERAGSRTGAPENLTASAYRLLALLEWLPARASLAAFAAAGNFDGALRGWREYPDRDWRDTRGRLTAAGQAALDSWPDDEEIDAGEQAPVVEDALALVWRSLVVWLVALAALTLMTIAL